MTTKYLRLQNAPYIFFTLYPYYFMKSLFFLSMLFLLFVHCKEEVPQTNNKPPSSEHEAHEEEDVLFLTPEQIKTISVSYGSVEMKQLSAVIEANGALTVPNYKRANATSLYGGVIQSLNLEIGDNVVKGQVIATIAHPQFIQIQEEYLGIDSKITFAEQELNRQTELNEGGAGARKNLQSAISELNILKTRKAALYQQIRLMGIDPRRLSRDNLTSTLTVLSPLKGTIGQLFARVGSYVDVSSPICEIVDNASLHLDLNVFEKDLPLLKIGQTIHFTLANNPEEEYDAVVYSIGASFEGDTKTIRVHCTVKGNKRGLIDGMNIKAVVSLDETTHPAVPTKAIINSEGKDYIFIVQDKAAHDTDKDEDGEKGETHQDADHKHETQAADTNVYFKKIEVVKGISRMGYTAVTFVQDIDKGAKIVVNGAFFINAKSGSPGEHAH